MLIRSVIAAAILGTAAAAAVYSALPRIANRAAEPETWPICTTMSSVADEGDWTQLDPDFASGKKDLAAGDWQGAIAALKLAALRDPRNPDLQNYIGYAYRRLGQLEPAFAHYRLALTLDPRHRAAHGHLGIDREAPRSRIASGGFAGHLPYPLPGVWRSRSGYRGQQNNGGSLSIAL